MHIPIQKSKKKRLHFPSPRPRVSRLALLQAGKRTHVWFSNKKALRFLFPILTHVTHLFEIKNCKKKTKQPTASYNPGKRPDR